MPCANTLRARLGALVVGVRGGAGRGGRVFRGDGGRPDGGAEHAGAGGDVRRQRHQEPPGGLLRRGAVSVQHSLTDRVPGHGPHWEAGQVKVGGQLDSLGRPRLQNGKVKVNE